MNVQKCNKGGKKKVQRKRTRGELAKKQAKKVSHLLPSKTEDNENKVNGER